MAASKAKSPTSESVGLLYKTVFHSPQVKYIIPLQIRCAERSDVAIVGERHIEIKNVSIETGRLHFLASKADFGSRICAAKAIGKPHVWDVDSPASDLCKVDARLQPSSEKAASQPPPQALIITLESGYLLFITLAWDTGKQKYFVKASSITLPSQLQDPASAPGGSDRPVHFLAVDPEYRAIATASLGNGRVFFCGLRERAYQEEHIADHVIFRGFIDTDITIHQFDFLFPPLGNSTNKVYLFLVGTDKKSERLTMKLFTWTEGTNQALTAVNLIIPPEFLQGW